MFYAHFVLAKKGPLARIWLAAHWDKKLTKAHVFETNIEKSVEGILQPKVKMALRTSGHLLLGVVRIYSRKAKYLLADCNEAFVKIKMAFRPGMVDLPEESREAAVNAITLPEVFHDFDTTMPELNDVDIQAQFSLNQSRAEEITMREDYGNISLVTQNEGFGDIGFDPPELMRDGSEMEPSLDQANLLFGESSGVDRVDDKLVGETSSVGRTSHLEMDAPIRDDGFGGNLGQDIMAGGLFGGGLFDDAPMGEVTPVDTSSIHPEPDKEPVVDSDDDDGDRFGGPPSVTHSDLDSPPMSPPPPVPPILEEEAPPEELPPPPPEQTTLIHNEEESFALAPVDASALKGWSKAKRKRKLIVDEVKNISGEEMKAQLSDTSDIVTTLDLAPPTKRLMHWKETGGVEKLFALPGRTIPARSLFKGYQRHLTSRACENEDFGMVPEGEKEGLNLEQVKEVEQVEPVRKGRKRKLQDNQVNQTLPVIPEVSIIIPEGPVVPEIIPVVPEIPVIPEVASPIIIPPPEPLESTIQTPAEESVEREPTAQQLSEFVEEEPPPVQEMPVAVTMENVGYDQNNPVLANVGYDEHIPPVVTPGAVSERGPTTPWNNEDYEFPASVGPPEEQQTDETYEQFEARVLNKRAAHLYHLMRHKLKQQERMLFSDMTHRNNRKQVAQKFYTLLVLKKHQAVELEQESAYQDIVITVGPKFDSASL